jgi:Tfp pilus assembly protein PilF
LLHEMATGRLPFRGKSLFDLTAAVLREPAPELPEGVGPGLISVITRCLAKHAGQRYQNGGEVRAAVEMVEPPSRTAGLQPPPGLSRRHWLWTTTGVLILAAATFVGISKWQGPRRYAPPPSKVREANEYFQRAMVFMLAQQDLPRSRQLLEKALALDPRFANARAWYGFTHALLIDSGQSNDTSWLYKAEEELRQALQDDPKSARAHAALAMVYGYQGRKELMPLEARRAIELDPNEKDGPNFLAMYHQWNGEYEQCQALYKSVLDSDPLWFASRANYGETMRQMGDPGGSIREQEKVLEQDPKSMMALTFLAMAYQTRGDAARARETLASAQALEPRNYQVRLLWALQLAIEGKQADALREMDSEVLKFGELIFCTSNVAEFYAILGDRAKSLDWLDRAVRAGDERADWFQRDPLLANIQKEPRFKQIIDGIRYRREQQAKSKH